MKREKKHIHFMGIGGSGMSAVALIAHNQGYKVSGCDLVESTPYIDKVKKLKIPVFVGHDPKHLKDVDILAVTPAAFFQSKMHTEVTNAQKKKILMTWQKFLGKHLHKGKKVICIAGTHGKSTTTAMAGLLLENAGLDPSVMIGATVKEWATNFRFGKGEMFVTEADEFFDNYLNYKPEIIVLNNVEYEHVDYFKTKESLYKSFEKFIKNLVGERILIVNQDSNGVNRLIEKLGNKYLKTIKVFGYTIGQKSSGYIHNSLQAKVIKTSKTSTIFRAQSDKLGLIGEFKLNVLGLHNVSNALGVILMGKVLGLKINIIKKSLSEYSGIARRIELLGIKRGVSIYDDYAHHPTEVVATIRALRQRYPKNNIWVVFEPHSYSRMKILLNDYINAFDQADRVVITPIFKGRDTETLGITGASFVKTLSHNEASYINSFKKIVEKVKNESKPKDVILVMGAGESYKWAREILRAI